MKYNLYDHRQNVLELQNLLRINHLLEGGVLINPDGIFDHTTREAVLQFQTRNGIEATGIADYETWNLLAEYAKDICKDTSCLIVLT